MLHVTIIGDVGSVKYLGVGESNRLLQLRGCYSLIRPDTCKEFRLKLIDNLECGLNNSSPINCPRPVAVILDTNPGSQCSIFVHS